MGIELDPELNVLFQRLSKRHAVTAAKALEELSLFCDKLLAYSTNSTDAQGTESTKGTEVDALTARNPKLTAIIAKAESWSNRTQNILDLATSLMSQWPAVYRRMTIDYDRRVRYLTNHVMAKLVKCLGKNLGPTTLKAVLGSWISAQFDPNSEVAIIAQDAFNVGSN